MLKKNYLDNKYLRLLFLSLVIILALIFVQDFAEFLDEHSDKVVKLGTNQQCNSVSSICSASMVAEGEFRRISFALKSVDSAKSEFSIMLNAVGFDFEGIDSVAVSFEMPGEDLEAISVKLSADKSSHQPVPENWHAMVKLTTLYKGRSDWLAMVRLKSSSKEYRAEFPCSF